MGLCRPRSTLLMAFCDPRLLRTWQGRVSSCQVLRPLDFQLRITISLEYLPICPCHLCSSSTKDHHFPQVPTYLSISPVLWACASYCLDHGSRPPPDPGPHSPTARSLSAPIHSGSAPHPRRPHWCCRMSTSRVLLQPLPFINHLEHWSMLDTQAGTWECTLMLVCMHCAHIFTPLHSHMCRQMNTCMCTHMHLYVHSYNTLTPLHSHKPSLTLTHLHVWAQGHTCSQVHTIRSTHT